MRLPVLVTAAVAALAAASLLGCRSKSPNVPIALVATPAAPGGHAVEIVYTLRNPDTTAASIFAEYSIDGGGSFHTATPNPAGEGTTNLSATPGGNVHVFLWDALQDLGPGRTDNVLFLIIPVAAGNTGSFGQTFGFTIDDTDVFVREGDLADARKRAAAAALPEGGVVVAGGGGLSGLTEAFIAGPDVTETRAALETPRESAVAETTLAALGGGLFEAEPLVVAGTGAGGVTLSSIEAYDSGADAWSTLLDGGAAPLDAGLRVGHTLTRLADARILVAGGGPADDAVIDLGTPGAPSVTTISPGVGRSGHSATLLPDGRVLVAGGTDASGAVLGDTLVFSPDALAYSAGPALVEARTDHAAALSGKQVLVTGGFDALGEVTASAEISDALLTTFTATPVTMTATREAHTATGLADGTVLVVGGRDATGVALSSAERYFPVLGIFLPTRAGLEVARAGHQATPFGSGRVMISGGGTDAIEVYYPQSLEGSQTFDEIASRSLARAEHAVTALADGRALVTGGTDGRVVGGSPVALASAEVVDPNLLASSRTVPIAATMTAARRRHTATLLDDGTVLIVGGLDGMGLPLASLETFNPTTLTFGAVPLSLPFGLSDHTATRLADNTVLIAGGRRADGSSSSAAFLFTRTGPTLATLTATLTTPRQMHTATLAANGDVLLAGGVTTGGVATAACELYVPAPAGTTASASFVAGPGDLGVARFEHAAVRLDDGTILVAGGRGGALGTTASPTADVRRFDAGVTTVTAVVSMLTARADFVAISEPGGRAVFAGGAIAATPGGGSDRAAPITAVAEVMTPGAATTTATFDPVIAAPRRGMATATLGDGTTVIIGGRREAGIVVPGGDQFSP